MTMTRTENGGAILETFNDDGTTNTTIELPNREFYKTKIDKIDKYDDDDDKPICIREINENLRRVKLGIELSRPLKQLNNFCDFKNKYKEWCDIEEKGKREEKRMLSKEKKKARKKEYYQTYYQTHKQEIIEKQKKYRKKKKIEEKVRKNIGNIGIIIK